MLQQYVVMPETGFFGSFGNADELNAVGSRIAVRRHPLDNASEIHVIASIRVDGPKLVEMSDEAELALRLNAPGLGIFRVHEYRLPDPLFMKAERAPLIEQGGESVTVRLLDRATGAPIAGARVAAFTNFRHRTGAEAVSDPSGRVELTLPAATRVERLYVFPHIGYWNHLRMGVTLSEIADITLQPLDTTVPCRLLSRFFGNIPDDAGRGVRIGVIDSGVERDRDVLAVEGGANCVSSELLENPASGDEWWPGPGADHGTHVAGIIAQRGMPGGPRGVVPGATIRSYRVFPHGSHLAQTFDIIDAIDRAVRDDCSIINLSLGMDQHDPALELGIREAQRQGVLVVAAAGNDGMRPISYPAQLPDVVAVTAMGMRSLLPSDSADMMDDLSRARSGPDEFFAAFSNKGPRCKLIGPGVGVASTVPGGHAVMSGTSMAAPAIAGFAAALLWRSPDLRRLAGQERAAKLATALFACAQPLGFGREFEGFGLPDFDLANTAIQYALKGESNFFLGS